METRRIEYIDIAKGIGILLVVLGHNALVSRFSLRLIYSFHMPLFFFLSGFFFNASLSFREFLGKRFHGLLKPYFFTVFLIYLFYLSFGKLSLNTVAVRLLKSFYGAGEYVPWLPLWFLPHLFLVSLFAFFVLRLPIKNKLVYWLFLFVLLAAGVWMIDWFASFPVAWFGKSMRLYGLPFSADLLLVSGFYFLLGAETRPLLPVKWLENLWLLISTGVFLAAVSILVPTRLDLASRAYPSFVLNTLEALAGIWFTLALARQMDLRAPALGKAFAYLGRISLIILIFHYPIQGTWQGKLEELTRSVFVGEWGSFLAGVLGSVLIYELFIKNNPPARYGFGLDAPQLDVTQIEEK